MKTKLMRLVLTLAISVSIVFCCTPDVNASESPAKLELEQIKKEYPEWTDWGYEQGACDGFADMVIARTHGKLIKTGTGVPVSWADVNVGDAVSYSAYNTPHHVVVIYEKYDDSALVCEGNVSYFGSPGVVSWSRTVSAEELGFIQ